MKEETKLWLTQAQEHFDDAIYLFNGSRYSLAVYCCHQALEKILKAIIVEKADIIPPKSHNLDSLARETMLSFPDTWNEDLAEITRFFWRVRYPDLQQASLSSKEKVQTTIDKTKEIFLWIAKQLDQQ